MRKREAPEAMLTSLMAEHLGHEKLPVGNADDNARNGKSCKILKGQFGELPIEVPRDRRGNF